jgi:hypothetical protein
MSCAQKLCFHLYPYPSPLMTSPITHGPDFCRSVPCTQRMDPPGTALLPRPCTLRRSRSFVLMRKRSRSRIVTTPALSTFTEMNVSIDHLHEDHVDEWRLAACSSVGYGALTGRFDTTLAIYNVTVPSANFRLGYDCAWDIVRRPLLESSPTLISAPLAMRTVSSEQ